MRDIVPEPASCPRQQLPHCYNNKLHILSDVKDFAQAEAAFGCVGMRGGNWKNPEEQMSLFFIPAPVTTASCGTAMSVTAAFYCIVTSCPSSFLSNTKGLLWRSKEICYRCVTLEQQPLMFTTCLEEFCT